jgi:AcrR family transcriptional regulator
MRDRLVEVGWGLLLQGGPPAVTMKAVASALGVTSPALYRHVASQDELLDLLRERAGASFAVALVAGLRGGDARERLRSLGLAYVEFGLDHPAVYRLLFVDQPMTRLSPAPTAPGAGYRLLVDRVAEVAAAGGLPADADPDQVAMLLWATVHGLVTLFLGAGGSRVMDDATWRATARGLLDLQLALLGGGR